MFVRKTGDGLSDLKKAIDFLNDRKCLIGIPEAKASRKGEINNAELAFIHSHGSPRLKIPARPFLEPAIEDAKEEIAEHLKLAATGALDGDTAKAEEEMHKAGLIGESAAKDYISSGNLAPNSEFTIRGGWMRNRISGRPFYAKPKNSNTPLIDTGSLRSSITHVIEGE